MRSSLFRAPGSGEGGGRSEEGREPSRRASPPSSVSNVTNLSALHLSPSEQEILERGLTFITTPSLPDRDLLRRDLHTYHRRLKILDYFKYNTDYFYLPFTTPSIWEPALKSVSKPIRQLIAQDLRSFRDCWAKYRGEVSFRLDIRQIFSPVPAATSRRFARQ